MDSSILMRFPGGAATICVKILVSNDDGYQAYGIRCLAAAMSELGEVVVVAPDRNRSGASNSLTLDVPIRVEQVDERLYYVNGTPTDCVHIGITGLLDFEPDMVVSGINNGANLGDDTLYSGTVAAAMEGRFLGLPAVAISLVGHQPSHFETAAELTRRLIARLISHPLPRDTILSVNVPDLPMDEIRGWQSTRLGFRHRSEPVVRMNDPRGRPVYWVGPAGQGQDAGPGTDFHAVANGYVSVTPLKIDLTHHEQVRKLDGWLETLGS
jgi:5'-nucleotidase